MTMCVAPAWAAIRIWTWVPFQTDEWLWDIVLPLLLLPLLSPLRHGGALSQAAEDGAAAHPAPRRSRRSRRVTPAAAAAAAAGDSELDYDIAADDSAAEADGGDDDEEDEEEEADIQSSLADLAGEGGGHGGSQPWVDVASMPTRGSSTACCGRGRAQRIGQLQDPYTEYPTAVTRILPCCSAASCNFPVRYPWAGHNTAIQTRTCFSQWLDVRLVCSAT
jgi:hypothetical protein